MDKFARVRQVRSRRLISIQVQPVRLLLCSSKSFVLHFECIFISYHWRHVVVRRVVSHRDLLVRDQLADARPLSVEVVFGILDEAIFIIVYNITVGCSEIPGKTFIESFVF